ncbi:MAG TPA: 30S ribosomal protein S6 [Candidatus Eisenbacteria bacterium]|nr:30S ribosomal protein S6 [Candidatus Eisenbacteria bacterium]
MTKYETVYILDPGFDEVKAGEVADRVSGWIKDLGGEVVEVQKWGKRRLAYEIHRKRDGVYTLVVWSGQGPMMKEIERRLQLDENVLRVLSTVYVPPEMTQGVAAPEVAAAAVVEDADAE